jgi:hypothetical protein
VAQDDPCDASEGLTREKWENMNVDGVVINKEEVFRLTYYGGVCHEIRKEVSQKSIQSQTFMVTDFKKLHYSI